jgi:hypothetical protein
MTPVIAVIFAVVAIALTFSNAVKWYSFESDYRFHGEFQGNRYDCTLRFANLSHNYRCFAGADESGLYLLAYTPRKYCWWRPYYKSAAFKQNLQIPWGDLRCRPETALSRNRLWFDVLPRKIFFCVPKDIGDKLLHDGGAKFPTSNTPAIS